MNPSFLSLLSLLGTCHSFSLPSSRIKDTNVNVAGRAYANVIPPPRAVEEKITLTNYMQLPVEQYVLIPMPLGSTLTRIKNEDNCATSSDHRNNANDFDIDAMSAEQFELVVPTITFFNLSLQPVVYASVHPQEDKVVIISDKCVLRGSSFIDKVKLNDRFDFSVRTTLSWEDPLASSFNEIDGLSTDEHDNVRKRGDDHDDDKGNDGSLKCSIIATTKIDVKVDVPRPFNSLPKVFVEKTGNAAMNVSLKLIQGNFVKNLAHDYEKWANDLEYRLFRASLSEKKEESKNKDLELVSLNQSL